MSVTACLDTSQQTPINSRMTLTTYTSVALPGLLIHLLLPNFLYKLWITKGLASSQVKFYGNDSNMIWGH